MLKPLLMLAACGLVVCYSDIDDTFNYDAIANNITALRLHLDCYIDKGPCDKDAIHYKDHMKDAFLHACKDCSDLNRHAAHSFISALLKMYPEGYAEFRNHYDPNDKNFASLEAVVDRY